VFPMSLWSTGLGVWLICFIKLTLVFYFVSTSDLSGEDTSWWEVFWSSVCIVLFIVLVSVWSSLSVLSSLGSSSTFYSMSLMDLLYRVAPVFMKSVMSDLVLFPAETSGLLTDSRLCPLGPLRPLPRPRPAAFVLFLDVVPESRSRLL
jgi:hypothetical protein